MARIDQETVNRILDATDIVDVVGDFVKLKRRGANYVGLCPFHNERTPSFSVSKSKGLCKCFSCGKGGSAVGFLMELEQMSYVDALKYLAKKYNIEVKERELTPEEREVATARESMLAVNTFALEHFEHNLLDEEDGRDIGLSYFRERGISDSAIKRFHLGYALDRRNALYDAAIAQGYDEKYLLETGLCIKNDRGQVYDRFKGRVIYPVFSVAGKVVAFGGRILRNEKGVGKYVNSPESSIYVKSNEVYGLYQAKQSIVKKNKCILVEGYMDVISMSQSGIENVVSSSGTSLTDGQIRLIRRFTDHVTVIYDSDPAGIKASLRGIDMLLAEDMKVTVLLLPEGDDPDSFAQSHTLEEIEAYMAQNETDFIRFKTKILLEGSENDPIKKASVISDIVRSIACIPDAIARIVYIGECSRLLGIDEMVLKLEVEKQISLRLEAADKSQQQAANIERLNQRDASVVQTSYPGQPTAGSSSNSALRLLEKCETDLLRYVLKYGTVDFCDVLDAEGNTHPLKLIEYVDDELRADSIEFSTPAAKLTYQSAMALFTNHWKSDYAEFCIGLETRHSRMWDEGQQEIQSTATDLADIKRKEGELRQACEQFYNNELERFACDYIVTRLVSSPEDGVRKLTTDLVSERYQLSKVYTKHTKIETERERIIDLVPKSIAAIKDAHITLRMIEERNKLAQIDPNAPDAKERMRECMQRIASLTALHMELSRNLGDRVITPRR